MSVTIERIQEKLVEARQEAKLAGVPPADLDAVAAVITVLEVIGLRGADSSVEVSSSGILSALPETFAEWANHYTIKTHYDRLLAIAVYLLQRGTETLTTADVHRMYEKARWRKPANPADTFAKAAEQMLVTEAEDPSESDDGLKLWRITRTGFQYFEGLRID